MNSLPRCAGFIIERCIASAMSGHGGSWSASTRSRLLASCGEARAERRTFLDLSLIPEATEWTASLKSVDIGDKELGNDGRHADRSSS